ncbi:hypothetical protein BT67DRAFT_448305 [Trichocladium antarcticum]|uniref:Alpha-ketoglutarate-dependent dioxygenase AlkB-like domain-containing protein n=1 Tax=Trichocladium antarcticum TaxID=1450529 RepID=A0AAN6UQ02_9PEZI|nr:hypothetical protein BT67DRAFT_448305 [Trichocladium antarcticum]
MPPSVRTSTRLAAQRAQTAIKRSATTLDTSTAEEPDKRPRLHPQDEDGDYTDPGSKVSAAEQDTAADTILELVVVAPTTKRTKINVKSQRAARSVPIKTVDETKTDRPLPVGQPLVWAKGRGALCEALPYFHAFQSSLYSSGLNALGFLIDQETDQRDVFSEQVIISSIGGGREKNPLTGTMIRKKDANDKAAAVCSIRNTYRDKGLVAVIAVLGYFHITDMWKEKQIPIGGQDAVMIWRIRFEKADLSTPSWWATDGAAATQTDVLPKAPVKTCQVCGTDSKEIFTVGWFCLNQDCKDYYMFPDGDFVRFKDQAYTQAFIQERTPFVGEIPHIKPPVPTHNGLHGTEKSLRGGFVCPDCGCCNRRVYWNRWVCENKDCQYTRPAPMLPYPKELLQQENVKFDKHVESRRVTWGVNHNPLNDVNRIYDPIAVQYNRFYLPDSQTLNIGGYLVRQYFLRDYVNNFVLGSFSIFSSNDAINARPDGPDALFRELELTDIGLRRNPVAVIGHKLEGYSRHFQQNFGARYKFGVAVQSKGFSEAPDVILRGLHRLIWAKKAALAASNDFIATLPPKAIGPSSCPVDVKDFNELLALGYMENDKINYHDDGEKELGPVVAALSLGSPSTMKFRPKFGSGFRYVIKTDRGKPVYAQMLEVPMKHGDIMVMIGQEIQKVYEHTVDPRGNRRFSLTARHIDPDRMISQEDKDDAAIKGAIPEHAQAFAYNGN